MKKLLILFAMGLVGQTHASIVVTPHAPCPNRVHMPHDTGCVRIGGCEDRPTWPACVGCIGSQVHCNPCAPCDEHPPIRIDPCVGCDGGHHDDVRPLHDFPFNH
jgi:hypothetical protein